MTKAKIEMENGGVMVVELYEDIAPITCENFINLVKDGFYNGLISVSYTHLSAFFINIFLFWH